MRDDCAAVLSGVLVWFVKSVEVQDHKLKARWQQNELQRVGNLVAGTFLVRTQTVRALKPKMRVSLSSTGSEAFQT